MVRLGDIATIERKSVVPEDIADGTTYVGLENIASGGELVAVQSVKNGELASNKFKFENEHILYGKLRPYLAKIAIPEFAGVCSTDILPIRATKRADRRFLSHFLRQAKVVSEVNRNATGANLPRVNARVLESLAVPCPSLDEQLRIANILDRADALRAKRRETIDRLDSLSQSIFHEMFGDPAANDRDWSTHDLGVVLRSIDSGSSPVCSSRPAHGNECGLLKLGAITTGTWKPGENKAFTDAAPNVRNEVRAGDVLFSRKNTPSLVAAVARVDEVPQRLFLPDLIFRLCIRDQEQMLPEFLTALLQYPTQKRAIQRLATGSAQSMVNISKAKLLGISVVVPPLELQQQFSNHMAVVEHLKTEYRAQLAQLDDLFLSLQDRAFKGEL
ncbi:restriction endonuclease subunit S [Arthrobacter rhombi]|uniref:restriction endonuclease subunit S n=1 Tax=Arthrobacter rhombi TaxID=71253 RepID=UPI003FD35472